MSTHTARLARMWLLDGSLDLLFTLLPRGLYRHVGDETASEFDDVVWFVDRFHFSYKKIISA